MPKGKFYALRLPIVLLGVLGAFLTLSFGYWHFTGSRSSLPVSAEIQQGLRDSLQQVHSYYARFKTTLPDADEGVSYSVEIWKGAPGLYRMEMIRLEQGEQADVQILIVEEEEVFLFNSELGDFYPLHSLGQLYLPHLILEEYWASLAHAEHFELLSEEGGTRHSYFLIEVYPAEPHRQRVRELAWLEAKSLLPVRIEVYDAFDLITQVTFFEMLQLNPAIEASMFQVYRSSGGSEG